ncbi:uncharacterized protein METZ01_LOCUS411911 [marine metagenome]|uniref:Uncharacterized protein n=1 Tax=marine metagenome TaxID=408172 RepID=A0A382WJN0_9ZZZZ
MISMANYAVKKFYLDCLVKNIVLGDIHK